MRLQPAAVSLAQHRHFQVGNYHRKFSLINAFNQVCCVWTKNNISKSHIVVLRSVIWQNVAAINTTLLFQRRSSITSVTYEKYMSPIDLMETITVHCCMFTVSRLQPSFQRERGCHTNADSLNSVLLKSKINLGGIHSKCYWWVWLCGTSLKKIYHAFKRAAGEAEGEINSNDDGSASRADEVYYYPPASAAAADGCVDTYKDEMTTHINQQRLTGASGTCQSGGVLMAISNSRNKGIEM